MDENTWVTQLKNIPSWGGVSLGAAEFGEFINTRISWPSSSEMANNLSWKFLSRNASGQNSKKKVYSNQYLVYLLRMRKSVKIHI